MKSISIFLVAVMLAYPVMAWDARGLLNVGSQCAQNDSIETQYVAELLLIAMGGGPAFLFVVGVTGGGAYVGVRIIKNLIERNTRPWSPGWHPPGYKGIHEKLKPNRPDKPRKPVKKASVRLTNIQRNVFKSLSDNDLKQMYGLARVGAGGKAGVAKPVSMAKVADKIGGSGKSLAGMSMKGIMNSVSIGGYRK